MIVDFHTHIFPPDVRDNRENYIRRDPTFAEMYSDPKAKIATVEDLLASMGRDGVDVSVALGFAWQDEADNARHNSYLLDSAANSGGRIVPFMTVNMADPRAEDEIERCTGSGARGIGELRPDSQRWGLGWHAGERLAEAAKVFGLILLFHVTEPGDRSYPGRSGCSVEAFTAYARVHPDLKIVGAHLGGGVYGNEGEAAPRVWVDTAAQPFLYSGDSAVAALGASPADCLLFGSDFPLISQSRQIEEIRSAINDEDACDRVLGLNAKSLLGI